jgi:hypothetical protein
MKNSLLTFLLGAVLVFTARGAEPALDAGLEQLRPFLGTWRGEFKKSTPEKPLVDIARWDRALNGKAVRVLHSINEGMYGGESLIRWDAREKKLVYDYFTTADFKTAGTMTVTDKKIAAHEKVFGDAGGPSEVRATIELRDDGTMVSKAEFLKSGVWEPGHEVVYRRSAESKVIFK